MDEYKLFARIYDPVLHFVLHKIRKKVLTEINRLNPHSVIDICCGTGNQLKYLKKHGYTNIAGIDISDDMLKQVNKGKEHINCAKKDAVATGYPENSFDAGIISFALHEKPVDISKAILDEARRIIKPGGHLLIADYVFSNRTNPFIRTAIHVVERIAGKSHYKNFSHYLQNGGMSQLMSPDSPTQEYLFHGGATRLRIYSLADNNAK